MDAAPESQATSSSTETLLSGATTEDFTNANTITKWLLRQPEEIHPQVAQAIFDRLVQNASQSRQHQGTGQACVKLCSFVQQCAKSSDEALRRWAFAEVLSMRLFHFYLEWYEHDSLRALRLVLDFLAISAGQNPYPETERLLKENILQTLVCIAVRKYPRLLIKSGLQCLEYLVTKQALQLHDIARKYREMEPSLGNSTDLELWKSFTFHLFSWMELSYVGPLAGKCIVHVFRGLNGQEEKAGEDAGTSGFTVELWLSWLQDSLARRPDILEDIKNYVLVPIFKADKASALTLLQIFNRTEPLALSESELTDQAFMLQLAALELGKRFGLVEEPSSQGADHLELSSSITLQESVLDSFLSHPSVPVRSSAFALLVSSQATTKPFSQTAFALLRRHLAAFHTDYDARFRNEVLGLTKSLIRRVKNVITVSERSLAGSATREGEAARPATRKKFGPEAALKDDAEAIEIRDRHQDFLEWYMDFLKGELLPTASYQRHITALRAALLTIKLGKHAGAGDEFDADVADRMASDPSWTRLLLDLMLDPFDDVRDNACAVLSLFPPELFTATANSGKGQTTLLETLQLLCNRAQSLANRTGRADHGDGAARSQGLRCRWLITQDRRIDLVSEAVGALETKIAKGETDLGHAAIENPVHGDFAAISYIWQVLASEIYSTEQLAKLHQVYKRVFACSERIWKTVKHVLCDDSPEGHLPEEMEEIEGLDTKDLLSYSFRAVHESSNLMRLMVGTLRLEAAPGIPFPPLDIFRGVGDLAFEQLASLRHRGAFSTVSLTFTTCCQLTQRLKNVYSDIRGADNLLREWYQGAITCIETQASTTRRSAGIPDLISAVLSANAKSPSFDEVFSTLKEIAEKPARVAETDGSNLPQVHALNCIRGVFRSSLLSKKAESYLAVNLQLASISLKSEVWAIRNCGLLLLRSLIDCLLGTGESKATMESGWDGNSVRISYNKYPTLPGVILGLLQSADNVVDEVSSSAAEAVFPALDIIRRAGPPEEHRKELREYIEGYLGSRIWHVREIAARTLCSFFLQTNWAAEITRLLASCRASVNRLHGVLLTARFLLERKVDLGGVDSLDQESLEELLDEIYLGIQPFKSSPDIEATYLEILNTLAGHGFHVTIPTEPATARTRANPSSIKPSALLGIQAALKTASDFATANDISGLRSHVLTTLHQDVNTATRLLEALPAIWEHSYESRGEQQSEPSRTELCRLYEDVCIQTSAPAAVPGVRAQALVNLASLIGDILKGKDLANLPRIDTLERVWSALQEGEINPTLSYAITKSSGAFMAALTALEKTGTKSGSMEQRLRGWGVMIADSLDVEHSFDTRYAAATALESFFLGSAEHMWDAKYLPALSALYDCLIDDDDEVREVAASAAAGVLGIYLVPPVAADRLVTWLQMQYGSEEEFGRHFVCRMTGQPPRLDTDSVLLTPASEQLGKALEFDDSLFATEEQNLYIDEIRETMRWRKAFCILDDGLEEGAAYGGLTKWTELGLRALIQRAENEDGPLGWMADQHVFAACARIVLCAVAISRMGKSTVVRELLDSFVSLGNSAGIHGSLLEMAMQEEEAA